ncbi:MAG: DUF481 domain-containing protein [Burkholderiales bacterium]|jgi:putative salt-induced outer membrane protein YdiY|nr:DUF481 domain-containing protein [Burkholderiales bacterium]
MTFNIRSAVRIAGLACAAAAPIAQAQVTLTPDNTWRYLFTAGANATSGNSSSSAINLQFDGARLSDSDKWTFSTQLQSARNNGNKTTERYLLGSQYNRDINGSGSLFGFGSVDFLRDELANLSGRGTLAGGLGLHLIESERHTFDITGGLAYTQDNYVNPALVDGVLRDSYGRAELVLGEESNHKLTETTTFQQKFTVYPNLRDSGQRRAVFDAKVSVAMTKTLNLTAGLSMRYNSDPGVGLKTTDTALVTGVSWRFD